MEMHQVRYFLAVAQTLNFTRAAEISNVAQPSLSRAIQKLEDELGGALFHRERSLTHLSDLGRMMLPHLQQSYDAAQTAKALADSIGSQQVARLSLGVATAVVSPTLDFILTDLGRGLPGLELAIGAGSAEHLLEQALKGSFDLIVAPAIDNAPDRLESWPLFQQRFHMVARSTHRLAGQPAVSLSEVAGEVWIDGGDEGTALLRMAAASKGLMLEFRHRVDAVEQALRLVRLGLGNAILPSREEPYEAVAEIRFADQDLRCRIVLAAVSGRRRSVAADALVRAARSRSWPDF